MWGKLPDLGLSIHVVLATKILILTGQRRNEITTAKWENIDLDNEKIWRMPDTKNGKAHKVPLSDKAIQLFKELQYFSGGSAYVMPSFTKQGHMDEKVITRAIARHQQSFDIEHWTPHDLRRSFITGCSGLGVQVHLVELIVNHSLPAMLKPYLVGHNSEEIFSQQREIMEKWANHIEGLVNEQ